MSNKRHNKEIALIIILALSAFVMMILLASCTSEPFEADPCQCGDILDTNDTTYSILYASDCADTTWVEMTPIEYTHTRQRDRVCLH